MGAVRTHPNKKDATAPINSLVLFTDRMVTNCPIQFSAFYHFQRPMSRGSNIFLGVCHFLCYNGKNRGEEGRYDETAGTPDF
jgi:hypothetical protein